MSYTTKGSCKRFIHCSTSPKFTVEIDTSIWEIDYIACNFKVECYRRERLEHFDGKVNRINLASIPEREMELEEDGRVFLDKSPSSFTVDLSKMFIGDGIYCDNYDFYYLYYSLSWRMVDFAYATEKVIEWLLKTDKKTKEDLCYSISFVCDSEYYRFLFAKTLISKLKHGRLSSGLDCLNPTSPAQYQVFLVVGRNCGLQNNYRFSFSHLNGVLANEIVENESLRSRYIFMSFEVSPRVFKAGTDKYKLDIFN